MCEHFRIIVNMYMVNKNELRVNAVNDYILDNIGIGIFFYKNTIN